MKTIFRLLIISLAASLAGISCHGDLDLRQKGVVTAGDAWADETDAKANMYGMMSRSREAFKTDYMWWGEYRTGLWGPGRETQPARDNLYNNTISSTHGQADWTELYNTINHCNLILKNAPGISYQNEETLSQILGTAYFMRAFCYYWIGRLWGDAPVLTEGFESDKQEGLFPTRDPEEKVFEQVGEDLAQAEECFKEITSFIPKPNMPNLTAVYALQTDYFLWMAKVRKDNSALASARIACDNAFAAAAVGTTEVPARELIDSYAEIFGVTSKLNKEVIFAWSMKKDETTTQTNSGRTTATGGFQADWLCAIQYVTETYIENPVKIGSHQQWASFTDAYKALIDEVPSDSRSRVSYDFFFDAEKNFTHNWINKYPGTWDSGARTFDSDIIVYRYADLIMFDAEIKNEQNQKDQAIQALNRIALRAYGIGDYYPNTLTKAEVDKMILKERKKEFSAEGKLWWDYLRFGVAFDEVPSLVGRENERNLLLWPISQTSINKNPNLVQTDFAID